MDPVSEKPVIVSGREDGDTAESPKCAFVIDERSGATCGLSPEHFFHHARLVECSSYGPCSLYPTHHPFVSPAEVKP